MLMPFRRNEAKQQNLEQNYIVTEMWLIFHLRNQQQRKHIFLSIGSDCFISSIFIYLDAVNVLPEFNLRLGMYAESDFKNNRSNDFEM